MSSRHAAGQVQVKEVSQMAVYEYLCPKCRNEFELMRPMTEAEKPAKMPEVWLEGAETDIKFRFEDRGLDTACWGAFQEEDSR